MCVCAYVCEHDSVETVHSIEFKFGMYITAHRWTNPIDLSEYRMNNFYAGVLKRILMHYALWKQIL